MHYSYSSMMRDRVCLLVGLNRNYLVIEVATAVECQISLIVIKVYKPLSDIGHRT